MNGPFVSSVWRDVEAAIEAAASAGEGVEIVAVAAWEDADAVAALRPSRPHVRWVFARRGRGNQMNAGAAAAAGEWLVFLHADSRLPDGWVDVIRAALHAGAAQDVTAWAWASLPTAGGRAPGSGWCGCASRFSLCRMATRACSSVEHSLRHSAATATYR